MKKLTAEKCLRQIETWEKILEAYCLPESSERHLEAYKIALPILEQQESEGFSGWVKCAEGQMPPDRMQVILWDDDLDEHTAGHYSHQTGHFYNFGMRLSNEITYWRSAPERPKRKSEGASND